MTRPLLLPRLQQLLLQLLLVADIILSSLGYWLRSHIQSTVFTPTSKMFDKILLYVGKLLSKAERDRLDDKFERLELRLDAIERLQAEQNVRVMANREIGLSDNEALEQKMNALRAGQESILSVVNLRFSFVSGEIQEVKSLLLRN